MAQHATQEGQNVRVEIEGADDALRALRVMEPETAKQVGKAVSEIGKNLAGDIRGAAPAGPPMSGWKATSGIRGARGGQGWPSWAAISAKSRRRGMRVIVDTTSFPSMISAVYESAGIKGGRSESGRRMIANFEDESTLVKSGKYSGRLGRKVVSQQYPQIIESIREATQKAVAKVNRMLP